MSIIKVLLVAAALLVLSTYLKFFRSVFLDRIIALVLFFISVLAILFPDSTTTIAQILGVGRGADLLLYLVASGSAFVFILLYGKITRLERMLTELVRYSAIDTAERQDVSK